MFIVPIAQMPTIEEVKQAVPAVESASSVPFADVFSSVLEQQQTAQAQSQQDAIDLALGNVDNLHNISINSERSAAALELTVQMASRALSAYNTIMTMQI